MIYIIDRIENSTVICENYNRETLSVPLSNFKFIVKTGQVINIENESISINLLKTDKCKENIEKSTKNLWKND